MVRVLLFVLLPFVKVIILWEAHRNTEQIVLTTTADPGGDDNMEFATHDDDVCDNGQEPNDEPVMLFVPPAQAPSQREYIVGVDELTHQRDRKCACYPLCKQLADMCGGWNSIYQCREYGHRIRDQPQLIETMKREKRKLKNASDAARRKIRKLRQQQR